jgi:uncharacterized protein with ParB-like and HNH nuclease domain
MLDFGFSFEVVKKKNIEVYGITYYEWGEAKEKIGIFSFDKVIYEHPSGEFLAIKKPRKSKIWGIYRFDRNIVKLVYLNIYVDRRVWCWLLAEDWERKAIKRLEAQEEEKQEALERFRRRMKVYNEEFFGGKRVTPYICQQILHFEIVERMNAPNCLVISCEPTRRYFKPSELIIDLSTGMLEARP